MVRAAEFRATRAARLDRGTGGEAGEGAPAAWPPRVAGGVAGAEGRGAGPGAEGGRAVRHLRGGGLPSSWRGGWGRSAVGAPGARHGPTTNRGIWALILVWLELRSRGS